MSGIPKPTQACTTPTGQPSYSEVYAPTVSVAIPVTHMQEFSRFIARIHGRFKVDNGKFYRKGPNESNPSTPAPRAPNSHKGPDRTSFKSSKKFRAKTVKDAEKLVEQQLSKPTSFFPKPPETAIKADLGVFADTNFDLSSMENALPNASAPSSTYDTSSIYSSVSSGTKAIQPKRTKDDVLKFQGRKQSHYRLRTATELLLKPPSQLQSLQTYNYAVDNGYIRECNSKLDTTTITRKSNPSFKWKQPHEPSEKQDYFQFVAGGNSFSGEKCTPLIRLLRLIVLDHYLVHYDPFPVSDKFTLLGLVNAITENNGPAYIQKHLEPIAPEEDLFD